ncbi:FMN-dependent NADH-azoreductase [Azospirillum brasilense]|uniref:FMN-dependent NADH-azoreductase n=1 Tax=Azospirillum brasilense TaxID=192 RepID=UPI00190E317D|nr:NAD(P)H-dependent oxidoreductase [Azospirillum brasilense]MBK3732982.1 FMN-dependent NADH-azoreductase [Azospirillum brasilense]
MNLLHIDSSILGEQSVSRMLSKAIVQRLKDHNPEIDIVHRDLAAVPVPHLIGDHLAASPAVMEDIAFGEKLLDEFLNADVIVIGVALYNLTISSQLRTWIDRIVIAGKTFRYTENGPEGLAQDKRVVLAVARGGQYREGMSLASSEHAEAYLRSMFAFIGVTKLDVIAAEGLAISEAHRESGMQAAFEAISALDPCCAP